jgi:ribonuclease HI
MEYHLYADGGSRGNPGPAAGAAVLFGPGGTRIAQTSQYVGHATNNVAEYTGLILGLTLAEEHGVRQLEVRMDSLLVIQQMRGNYRVKHPNLIPLYAKAARLAHGFEAVHWVHVPREKNTEADALVNACLDAVL